MTERWRLGEDEQNYLNSVSSFLIGRVWNVEPEKFDTHLMWKPVLSWVGIVACPIMVCYVKCKYYNDDSCLIMTHRADLFGSWKWWNEPNNLKTEKYSSNWSSYRNMPAFSFIYLILDRYIWCRLAPLTKRLLFSAGSCASVLEA